MAAPAHSSTADAARRALTGWGRTAPSVAEVVEIASIAAAMRALQEAPARGTIARGLGRSYGDVAQNAGGRVLDLTGMRRVLSFDPGSGIVTAEAGCSLDELLRTCLPAGWFLPVTPGTRFVTVGGAIACDVHGKNHHRDGSIGRHVRSLRLLTPDGTIHELDPEGTPAELAATFGGLGLTGVVLEATLQLLPVETSAMLVDVERAPDLDAALARLESTDHLYRYSVAWLDCAGRGRRFGRSLLMRGNHAALADLPPRSRAAALEPPSRPRVGVPPWGSLAYAFRRPVAAAFNELYYRRGRPATRRLEDAGPFFYPLDGILDWNRLYGGGGFLQYQFVVPFGREDVLRSVLELVRNTRRPPLLVVLKRFGAEAGPLSFPLPGWTVALDFPLPAPGLAELLDRADELVAGCGGRVYLAKDARLRRELLHAMYPRLAEWRAVRDRLDPERRLTCDLARRLGLVEDEPR